MNITTQLADFIREYCEYDWRDNNRKFYVWIPLGSVQEFVSMIDFVIFEYAFIEDCALFKNKLCVELSYFVDDLDHWFPKVRV